ncbi:hypothetical protein AB4Y63_05590 [Leifsonia sp. YAF41]|uniref:hypothetical protein n=1 Tax=Leifsonia sp. YAF41 TaxID=3233086 RepID=UPI003F9D7DB3
MSTTRLPSESATEPGAASVSSGPSAFDALASDALAADIPASDLRGSDAPASAGPDASIRRTPRLRLALILGTALVVGLAIAVPVLHVTAQSSYDAARESLAFKQSTVEPMAAAMRSNLTDAKTLLDESNGHVLDENPRSQLAAAIVEADRRMGVVETEIAQSEAAAKVTPNTSILLAGFGLRQGIATLNSFKLNDAGELASIESTLSPAMNAVTGAVAAWTAEQKRLRYTKDVYAAGWYPELDACRGSVDVTARYGVATIAEHWSCGGRDFPDEAGTLIELTGLHAGTYRVEGIKAMLNQATATTADLPTGYDLLYQTCQNGQSSTMSMTALTKVS